MKKTVLEICWPYCLKVLALSWLFVLCVEMGTNSIMEIILLDPSSQLAYQVAVMETASGISLKRMYFRKHPHKIEKILM